MIIRCLQPFCSALVIIHDSIQHNDSNLIMPKYIYASLPPAHEALKPFSLNKKDIVPLSFPSAHEALKLDQELLEGPDEMSLPPAYETLKMDRI